jgi:hypothetical protein
MGRDLARLSDSEFGAELGVGVPTGDRFRASYEYLEARMKARSEADGDVFLPNPEPLGPVEYVFVCMEPSLGR